jgi:hypothetical protein
MLTSFFWTVTVMTLQVHSSLRQQWPAPNSYGYDEPNKRLLGKVNVHHDTSLWDLFFPSSQPPTRAIQ